MIRKKKPAIYSGPYGWGWVRLSEVEEIVGQNAWVDFFHLSKDADSGVLSVAFDEPRLESKSFHLYLDGMVNESVAELSGLFENRNGQAYLVDEAWDKLFVPAGWALDVVERETRVTGRVVVEVNFSTNETIVRTDPEDQEVGFGEIASLAYHPYGHDLKEVLARADALAKEWEKGRHSAE